MFAYYLELAVRSLKRSKALTALMIAAVALGIGTSMVTLTVLHVVSGDPLPERSGSLYLPRIDPRDDSTASASTAMPSQVTWLDGNNLLRAGRARQQALMLGGQVAIEPDAGNIEPFIATARYTSMGFFDLFDVPFLRGAGWSAADDEARARVAVISSVLEARLFHGENAIGRTVRVGGVPLRVIGVLAPWRPVPHFYDLYMGHFAGGEDVYLPLSTARSALLPRGGGIECWGKGSTTENLMETAECTWLQFWVRLDSAADVAAYRRFLDGYVHEQFNAGRFRRNRPAELTGLMAYLDERHVVPGDLRLQVWLAFGFLLVCLANTVGLMLAKFMRRGTEIGVRRALGASRGSVFAQMLTEAGIIGLAGGLMGLVLALAGLALVRTRPDHYAQLARLDLSMLATTFVLSITAALLAGLFPAWRASRLQPGLQLKSQ